MQPFWRTWSNPSRCLLTITKIAEPMSTLQSTQSSNQLALCFGKKSPETDKPQTPAEALKQLIGCWSEGKLIYIQDNGSVVEQKYTYIWQRATHILRGLRATGFKPGNKIIFQLSKGDDFTAAFWSCLMGGFVPVPLSVCNYTASHYLVDLLRNTWQFLEHPVVITDDLLSEKIHQLLCSSSSDKTIISLSELESYEADTHFHHPQPSDLALLLSSSGTTGRSKLIAFNSETLINLLLRNPNNLTNGTKARQKGIYLRWLPLSHMSGLKIIIPNAPTKIHLSTELVISNPKIWLDTIEKYRVNHAFATNFFLSSVVEYVKSSPESLWNLSCVKRITIGSEPIVVKTIRSFLSLLTNHGLSENVLYFAYGLTECNPIAVSDKAGFTLADKISDDSYVEIGSPSPDHTVRIVDRHNSLVTEGIIGKIQVKGPWMTVGYYKNPQADKDLFTEDGWLNTGDLGWLKNGRLTITDREKGIIIINALNYSSHEIELTVEEVAGVESRYTAACAVRGLNSVTDELLILFHPCNFEKNYLIAILKNIRQKIYKRFGLIVSYLIPVEKAEISRTMTGKIQRRRLKQRFEAGEFDTIVEYTKSLSQEDLRNRYVAPQNSIDRQLIDIWQQVLSLEKIGIHDNFFELGGHSLLANQMLWRIQDTLAIDLSINSLFNFPTVAELASEIERQLNTGSTNFLLLKPTSKTKVTLSYLQQKYWFKQQLEDSKAVLNIPRTLEIEGSLDREILKQSLQTIVERHAILRTTFFYQDDVVYQQVHQDATIKLSSIDLQHLPPSQRKDRAYQLLKQEAQQPFELENKYLVRFSLCRLSTTSHIFVVNMHHIISDGWSFRIFWQELFSIYNSLKDGKPNPLPSLPIQYIDFVHWQQQWLKGTQAKANYDYWSKQLAHLPTEVNLPWDRSRSPQKTYGMGKGVCFEINTAFTQQLRHFCGTRNITLFIAFLATWQLLLCYYCDREDVAVISPISGRNYFQTQSLIGTFANVLLLRTQCRQNLTFEQFLIQVRQNCLAAHAHQDISILELAEQLGILKNSEFYLPKVGFSLDNYSPLYCLKMSGLETKKGRGISSWLVENDLQLVVKDPGLDTMVVSLFYNSDLFDVSTAIQILSEFEQLLATVIDRPCKTIDELLHAAI